MIWLTEEMTSWEEMCTSEMMDLRKRLKQEMACDADDEVAKVDDEAHWN